MVKDKLKFYDRVFWLGLVSFIASFIVVINLTVDSGVSHILTIFTLTWIVCELIFIVGMLIHSAKRKQWGWFVVILIMGVIFPVIYYFGDLRKEFKRVKK